VTTDCIGRGYEVDVTKNGKTTEVHLDSSFKVHAGPGGMPAGPGGMQRGPGGMHGGPAGPPPGGPYAPPVSG
jgi:hypothetical protein